MSSKPVSRRRRWLIALGAAIVLAYSFYLGSANWFLSSAAADRVINRKPEKLRIEWSRARSWLPGVVVLDDVKIAGANRQFDWGVEIDHVLVEVALWRLPFKVFSSELIVGEGLDFHLEQRALGGPGVGGVETAAAPKRREPGAREPEPREPGAREPGARKPWRLELDGIRIRDLRRVAIGQSSLIGSGQISGGLDFAVRGPLRFDVLSLAFTGARLERAGELVGENLTFELEASSAPFKPGDDTVRRILGGVSGSAAVSADVESIAALGFLLEKPEWLSFGGSGHLESAFRLRRGVVAPGGHLDFDASKLQARIADWTVEGGGTIGLKLPEDGPHAAVLEVDFEQFAIRRGEREVAHIRGEDLRVALDARAFDLEHGLEDLDLRVDVPPSRVDFAAYTSYLPKSPFRIDRGEGTLSSWFEYSDDKGDGRGEVEISVVGASGAAGDLGVGGDLRLHTLVRSGDLDAKRFDVTGSSLELKNVRVTKPGGGVESEGWWATFATETARLEMKEPLEAEIAVRARMRDAKPFLTALASQRKALFWIDELIGVKDVEGRATIDVDGQSLAAREVAITGRRLDIEGDVRVIGKEREGLLFIEYGPFSTALEMNGHEREWKLFGARRWFEERRSARRHAS
jgi:hypothetical protein